MAAEIMATANDLATLPPASMRPRRMAAEIAGRRPGGEAGPVASMRPRRMAAEITLLADRFGIRSTWLQ